MKYKFKNGGIVKLQNAGTIPKNKFINNVLRRYLFGKKSDDEIRRNLYDNLYPYDYGEVDIFESMDRVKNAANGNRDWGFLRNADGYIETDNDLVDDLKYEGDRDDIFATYLGIPENERHSNFRGELAKVGESSYKPTIGSTRDKYYKINLTDEDKDWLMYLGLNVPLNESKVSDALSKYFGPHTVSHGFDKNGEYISYYDNWDINPLFGQYRIDKNKNIYIGSIPTLSKSDTRYEGESFLEGILNGDIKYYKSNNPIMITIPNPFVSKEDINVDTGDKSLGIGTPVNFYDRLYFKDYLGTEPQLEKDEYYGGTIRPVIKTEYIQNESYKQGGILKGQNSTKLPETQNKQEKPKPLIPKKNSTQQNTPPAPLQPALTFEERLKQIIAKLKETQRPKVIGPWETTYGKPTRVVDDGGKIA